MHRGAGGNKIVKDDNVALFGRFSAKGEYGTDTMLRVALGDILIEGYAEKFSEPGRNERGKISDLVATLGRYNFSPVAGGERMTEDLPDKGIHVPGKLRFEFVGPNAYICGYEKLIG